VSSETDGGLSQAEPLGFAGSPEAAWLNLRQAVQDIGGEIAEDNGDYLWATFTTKVFRFVDDLECRMDTTRHVIHVRSASRIGHWDFGVNRRRVERLRLRFSALVHNRNAGTLALRASHWKPQRHD
jgi:uncharacterized protein (DUF1499 family)